MKIEKDKFIDMVSYNLPPAVGIVHFKTFDPKNPPPTGHYITLANDNRMQFDMISEQGFWALALFNKYEVTGYAKITEIYLDNQFYKELYEDREG